MDIDKILKRHPDKIPTLISPKKGKPQLPELPKNKYLLPKDMTINQVVYIIRRHLSIKPETAIIIFVNNELFPNNKQLSEIIIPGQLNYITYTLENTFG